EELLADIYERLTPSVVNITNHRVSGSGDNPEQFQEKGTGSGIIIDDQGHILTNNHVIDRADRLEVTLKDGSRKSARALGQDLGNDLAVIQIDVDDRLRSRLVPAPMGDSDKVRPGQMAIAIGNPFGFQSSMTSGIISSVGRTFTPESGRPIRHMIQIDAAVNPGNSGGPLINSAGQVVGITTAIESPVRGFVGVGFAVPTNVALRAMPEMLAGKTVARPWLGISGTSLDDGAAGAAGLKTTSGVYVSYVLPNSPAERARLIGATAAWDVLSHPDQLPPGGDVITSVDGHPVATVEQLNDYLETRRVGDRVVLGVVRGDSRLELVALLGSWPE
ncbi:MAG TPA: trypsin-like peptidase domain-containing protein, partial [Chloroflexota bacterium]|nr:trypsin-like peptidase domain-containing protein [Chloroflexota bacterium]